MRSAKGRRRRRNGRVVDGAARQRLRQRDGDDALGADDAHLAVAELRGQLLARHRKRFLPRGVREDIQRAKRTDPRQLDLAAAAIVLRELQPHAATEAVDFDDGVVVLRLRLGRRGPRLQFQAALGGLLGGLHPNSSWRSAEISSGARTMEAWHSASSAKNCKRSASCHLMMSSHLLSVDSRPGSLAISCLRCSAVSLGLTLQISSSIAWVALLTAPGLSSSML